MGQAKAINNTGSGPLSILDVINPNRERFSQPSGYSADDLDREHQAQALFFPALAAFIAVAQQAMALSDLRKDAFQDLLAAISDNAPSELAWDEAIAEARHA